MKDKKIACKPAGILKWVTAAGCLLTISLIVAACGSTTMSTTSSGMASVTTVVTDPATCQAPGGPFSHVFVTITDVQANVSSSAGA